MLANTRSRLLVDDLDGAARSGGRLERSRDPRVLERLLPAVLARLPGGREREFLRAAGRLSVVGGRLEVAVLADGDRVRAALLTLLDPAQPAPFDRWPWWGFSDVGGLRTEMGAPVVGLTVPDGRRAVLELSSGSRAQ
jgi:hypothetical protein